MKKSFSSFLPTQGRSAKEHGRGGLLKPWSPCNQSMPTHPPFQARLGADFRRTDGSGCRVRGKKSFTRQRCEEFHKTSKLRRILSSLPPDVRRRHCLTVTVHWSGEPRYQNPLFYIYWYEFKPVHLGIGFFVSSLHKPQQSHERLGLAGRHHGSSLSEGGAKDANISCACPETLSCSKPQPLQTRAEITCIRHEPIIKMNDQFEMTKWVLDSARLLDSSKVLEYHSSNVYFLLSAMRPWMILRCCAVLHFTRTVNVPVQTTLEVSLAATFGEVTWRNIATESICIPLNVCVTLARASDIGDECADGEDRFTKDKQMQVSMDWLVDWTSLEIGM